MRQLMRRLQYWLRHRDVDAALAEEIESHRAMRQERLEQSGVAVRDAASASRRALGNVTLAREDSRAIWIWPWLESVGQDLRYGVRSLSRQPGFTLMALVTLGIGIGLNTTLATMFTTMLWRPWAVANPAEVVHIMKRDSRRINYEFQYDQYRSLADNARLTAVIATSCGNANRVQDCTVKVGSEILTAEFVSGNYFRALAIGMERGRGFVDDEDREGAPVAVAVISHRLWERRFASDPRIIGTTIQVDGEPFTVIGVAARGFNGAWLLGRDVWLPLAAGGILRPTNRDTTWVEVAERLRAGISREQAQAELQSLLPDIDSQARQPIEILLIGTSSFSRPNDRQESYMFFAVAFLDVLLVLLLACANIGNLLLARTLVRGREIAVRASLGASRSRIVRQLLTESLVLAAAAAAVGVWIAFLLPALILDRALQSSDAGGHLAFDVTPDIWVLAVTAGMTAVTCLAFGLAPALHASRAGPADTLKDQARNAVGRFPLRAVLLSVQVATSIVLLVAAGLLVRGIQHASTRDLGFVVDGVTVVSFEPPASYDAARVRTLSNQLVQEVEALPGSEGFGITTATPFGDRYRARVRLPGQKSDKATVVSIVAVSSGYFTVLGLPIVAGRSLEAADARGDGILINEAFAAEYWPGESPLGRTIISGWNNSLAATRQVVGVVGNDDTEAQALRLQPPRLRIYEPITGPRRANEVHEGDDHRHVPEILLAPNAAGASGMIAALAAGLDSRVHVRTVPLEANRDALLSEGRFTALLAGVLGMTALVLAAVGVFGVFAYVVRHQTREIGIRMALGAQSRQVVLGVLAFGSRPLVVGTLAGLAAAMAAAQLLRGSLYGLSAFDPLSYVAVTVILGVAALIAVSVPAWQATRVDPIIALRSE